MPRESYYQSVDNPLRASLLPKRPLNTALPVKDLGRAERGWLILKVIAAIFFLDIFDTIARNSYDADIIRGGRASLVFWASIVLMFKFSAALPERWSKVTYVAIGLVSAPAAAAAVFLDIASPLGCIHAGIVAAGYVWLFCTHWTERCITSPLGNDTAASLRRRWKLQKYCAAVVPMLAIVIGLVLGSFAALLFLTTLFAFTFRVYRWNDMTGELASMSSWLTYDAKHMRLPGTFISPAGRCDSRIYTTLAACFVIVLCCREAFSITPGLGAMLVFALPMFVARSLLLEANSYRRDAVTPDRWRDLTDSIRMSTNPIERQSYYVGRVAADGSPIIVPRNVFDEHGYFAGDTGGGKTALGLSPFVEQTIAFGDASVIIIDLKADTLELMATMLRAAKRLRESRGIDLPLKYLSTRDDLSSHAFNPQTQEFFQKLSSYKRTDLLTGATSLDYGPDFGAAFYSSANSGVVNHTYKTYPHVKTFVDLAERCGHVLLTANRHDLHPEMRRNGAHVHEILKRLASFPPLNVSDAGGYPNEVIEEAIDLADCFRRPQLMYFHLSSVMGPGSAPALARFVTFFLLASAACTERTVPVYLVIDEFQRMVARNFAYMLQLARSMDVRVILANQSMEDLKTPSIDLIPTVEANCRFRQWFSVSASADRERLVNSSGSTVEQLTTHGESAGNNGRQFSMSVSEVILPRLSANDIALASDHPKQSIVRITRGEGYAQYSGLPFVAESDFHITEAEYQERKWMKWPHREYGTFIPDEWATYQPPAETTGPIVTTEIVGSPDLDDDPFADFLGGIATAEEPESESNAEADDGNSNDDGSDTDDDAQKRKRKPRRRKGK